jgi:hypothetical protein
MRETEKYTNRRVRRRQLPSTASYGCGTFRLRERERERGFTFLGFVECKGSRIYTLGQNIFVKKLLKVITNKHKKSN